METVHFIANYRRSIKDEAVLKEWLVTSVAMDQWMLVLLAMGTGRVVGEGPSSVDVTVARQMKSTTECMHVNRVYRAVLHLGDTGTHAGWPQKFPSWLTVPLGFPL